MSKLKNLLFLLPVALFSGKEDNALSLSSKKLDLLNHSQACLAKQYLQTQEALDEARQICPGADISFLTSRLADLLKQVEKDKVVMAVIVKRLLRAENV